MTTRFDLTLSQARTEALAAVLSGIEWTADSRAERLSQHFYCFSPVLKP